MDRLVVVVFRGSEDFGSMFDHSSAPALFFCLFCFILFYFYLFIFFLSGD